jgi:ParB family chromosome partitioning protein
VAGGQDAVAASTKGHGENARRFRHVTVKVEHRGRQANLLLTRRPAANGRAWLRFVDNGQQCDVALAEVRLLDIVEA